MGIVNVTPDSFSDGGALRLDRRRRCGIATQLVDEGADILDIGGESTRPGSPAVPLEQELARVLPVVREAVKLGVPVSVDTYKPEVMRAVLDLGADIVNDIWALRRPGAREAVAAHPSCGVCLMHMHRDPQTMQVAPMEGDVVPAVRAFLEQQRAGAAGAAGRAGAHRARSRASASARRWRRISPCSRASANCSPQAGRCWPAGRASPRSARSRGIEAAGERMVPSVAAAVLAVERGASIVRVHDVRETVAALAVWRAMQLTNNKDRRSKT